MRRAWLLSIGAFAVLLSVFQVAAQSSVTLSISPELSRVNAGDSFTVDIVLDTGGEQISSVRLSLKFDPSVVTVSDVSAGEGFQGGFFQVMGGINNQTGEIRDVLGMATGGTYVAGQTVFARVSLTASSTSMASVLDICDVRVIRVLDGENWVEVETEVSDGSVVVGVASHVSGNASFNFLPASPTAGEPVAFTDTSSVEGDTIVKWAWNFGDGGTSEEQNPSHIFSSPGTYTVALLITDSGGNSYIAALPVEVTAQPEILLQPEMLLLAVGIIVLAGLIGTAIVLLRRRRGTGDIM